MVRSDIHLAGSGARFRCRGTSELAASARRGANREPSREGSRPQSIASSMAIGSFSQVTSPRRRNPEEEGDWSRPEGPRLGDGDFHSSGGRLPNHGCPE